MDLEKVLDKWYETKKTISLLEKKCDDYKKYIAKTMEKRETDLLKTNSYTVNKRHSTRESISKKDVPTDIWGKYCNRSTFNSYILKKK